MNDCNWDEAPIPEPSGDEFSTAKSKVEHLSHTEVSSMSFGNPESGEGAIRRILSSYEIGVKLRQLRLRRKIALVDLGRHTGLSASMLSQLENSRLVPTLPTLVRIAMVFDVGVEYFFGNRKQEKPFVVVRKEERMRFPDHPDNPTPNYFFECLAFSVSEKAVQVYLAEIMRVPDEAVQDHEHEGAEFFHVLEGSVTVRYNDEEHVLCAGDSAYFDSSTPHAYRGMSRTPAKAMVVTAAPRI
ncbi:MAG: XRE family transcriptional regulator [Bryobacteraceae bacterium]|jgi:transcriptional regulator with XRE-family HTH domain